MLHFFRNLSQTRLLKRVAPPNRHTIRCLLWPTLARTRAPPTFHLIISQQLELLQQCQHMKLHVLKQQDMFLHGRPFILSSWYRLLRASVQILKSSSSHLLRPMRLNKLQAQLPTPHTTMTNPVLRRPRAARTMRLLRADIQRTQQFLFLSKAHPAFQNFGHQVFSFSLFTVLHCFAAVRTPPGRSGGTFPPPSDDNRSSASRSRQSARLSTPRTSLHSPRLLTVADASSPRAGPPSDVPPRGGAPVTMPPDSASMSPRRSINTHPLVPLLLPSVDAELSPRARSPRSTHGPSPLNPNAASLRASPRSPRSPTASPRVEPTVAAPPAPRPPRSPRASVTSADGARSPLPRARTPPYVPGLALLAGDGNAPMRTSTCGSARGSAHLRLSHELPANLMRLSTASGGSATDADVPATPSALKRLSARGEPPNCAPGTPHRLGASDGLSSSAAWDDGGGANTSRSTLGMHQDTSVMEMVSDEESDLSEEEAAKSARGDGLAALVRRAKARRRARSQRRRAAGLGDDEAAEETSDSQKSARRQVLLPCPSPALHVTQPSMHPYICRIVGQATGQSINTPWTITAFLVSLALSSPVRRGAGDGEGESGDVLFSYGDSLLTNASHPLSSNLLCVNFSVFLLLAVTPCCVRASAALRRE